MPINTNADILDRPRCILSRPQLVIHETPTRDDIEAERLIRELNEKFNPSAKLEILRWGGWDKAPSQISWVDPNFLPALKASDQFFFGLSAISDVVQSEREEWESLLAYRERRAG